MIQLIGELGLSLVFLFGLSLICSPKTALWGNRIGAGAMLVAILLTLTSHQLLTRGDLWVFMALGGALGFILCRQVAMIQMPQLVALLNGFGGAASALVALILLLGPALSPLNQTASALALAVGALTLSGSLVAAGKLDQRLPQHPVFLPYHTVFSLLVLLSLVVLISGIGQGPAFPWILTILSLGFGLLLAFPVGGADMPVTISLLNSLSGVAGSIAGFALGNPLVVAVGGIVGAAGLILTQMMCQGMNRSLLQILVGRRVQARPSPQTEAVYRGKKDPRPILDQAQTIVLIPGYGMALSGAQHRVKELIERLEAQGKEIRVAIHPVAGRMPGHMNVLLAEADLSYDYLVEMEAINPEFPQTDLVILIGANDIVNPMALEPGNPISGMPILQAHQARQIFVCNWDTRPGYAGVENPLYTQENVTLLLGDAKETLAGLMPVQSQASQALPFLQNAQKVVLIPGYGMALSGAQHRVKTLVEQLEAQGTEIRVAIHPVAGRMPGHMNVLLAEADLSYDYLVEMEAINPELPQTDLVVLIGANDIVNPMALEPGNPISGMPILQAHQARQIIVCNWDTKPGYAGVENPLYNQENVTLLLGDASERLSQMIAGMKA